MTVPLGDRRLVEEVVRQNLHPFTLEQLQLARDPQAPGLGALVRSALLGRRINQVELRCHVVRPPICFLANHRFLQRSVHPWCDAPAGHVLVDPLSMHRRPARRSGSSPSPRRWRDRTAPQWWGGPGRPAWHRKVTSREVGGRDRTILGDVGHWETTGTIVATPEWPRALSFNRTLVGLRYEVPACVGKRSAPGKPPSLLSMILY